MYETISKWGLQKFQERVEVLNNATDFLVASIYREFFPTVLSHSAADKSKRLHSAVKILLITAFSVLSPLLVFDKKKPIFRTESYFLIDR